MYIKSLSIKNFRCFDKDGIVVDFEKGVSGIIGKNGSGKTSIIEALNLVFGRGYIQKTINERDFHNQANDIKDEIEIVAYTRNPFFVSADVTYTASETSSYRQSAQVLIACNGLKLTIKRREKAERVLDDPFVINRIAIPIGNSNDESIFQNVLSDNEKPVVKAKLSSEVGYYNISFKLKSGELRHTRVFKYQLSYNLSKYKKFPISHFLSKDREKEVANTYSILAKILTDVHWRYRKTQETIQSKEFVDKYTSLSTHLRKVDDKRILINTINKTIEDITCEKNDFSIDFLDTNEPYKSAFISRHIPSKQLMPVDLGSGYHILFAYALVKYIFSLEKEPAVLLIDEPEMHLHVDWQLKLFQEFIKEKDIQVIYATQSENFLSLKYWKNIKCIKDNKIYPDNKILKSEITIGGQSYVIGNVIQNHADRNLHISTFLRDNFELFFSNKSILVEGPAEKYAFPKLLKLMNCDISKHSLSIIPVWGKGKIKLYQLICKCFGINFYTLYDKDRKQGETYNNNQQNLSIENNAIPNQVSHFSSSFESILGVSSFQNLIKKIDGISSKTSIPRELLAILAEIKKFIVN